MDDFDKSTFDPKAAAEARKKEMDQMAQKLEAGVKDVFRGENYKAYLDFCAKMPRYSVNNQILIMMQKPNATMCQSFTGWKEMGRFVKKGEKGIRVMAPAPYKMEREQDKIGADGKPVLDQDGEPVPRLGVDELTGSVEGYATLMEAIKQASPVPISFENIETGAKGSYIRLHCLRTCVAKRKNLSLKLCTYVIMALKSRDIMEALWNLKNIEMKLTIFLQLTAEEVLLIIIIAEVCGAI